MSLHAILALALLVGAFASGWAARAVVAERDIGRIHAQQAAEAARQALRASEASDAAFLQAQARVAAVRRADAAGDGLRVAAVALAASAPADGCQATANAARVLAELLGEVERAGREMARIADERGAAGLACERITADKE